MISKKLYPAMQTLTLGVIAVHQYTFQPPAVDAIVACGYCDTGPANSWSICRANGAGTNCHSDSNNRHCDYHGDC